MKGPLVQGELFSGLLLIVDFMTI